MNRGDDVTQQLREAFEARASKVEIAPDALPVIRGRIRDSHRRGRAWTVGLGAIATAAVATLVVVFLLLPGARPAPRVGVGSAPPPTSPTASAAGIQQRLPVYVAGAVEGRDVLYREYHPFPGVGADRAGQLRAALTDAISGRPVDPDYHGLWPAAVTVHTVGTEGTDTIAVDLTVPPAAGAPANPSLALQQLVYTATAVAAKDGPSPLVKVRVEVNGQPAASLWGVALSEPLTRSSSVDTLAPIWLSSPQEGDTVGPTFTVQIVGTVPAGVANLEVRTTSGAVVVRRTVALNKDAPERGDIAFTVTLDPGQYRIKAYYLADDGTPAAPDDHLITVA